MPSLCMFGRTQLGPLKIRLASGPCNFGNSSSKEVPGEGNTLFASITLHTILSTASMVCERYLRLLLL